MRNVRDAEILLARVLIAALFLPSGIGKIAGWPGIVQYIAHNGGPFPMLAGFLAIICEVLVTALILLGVGVRPLAVILAIYTIGTALIAHRYWQAQVPAAFAMQKIHFYKNVAIAGGLLALSAAGSGRFALRPDDKTVGQPS